MAVERALCAQGAAAAAAQAAWDHFCAIMNLPVWEHDAFRCTCGALGIADILFNHPVINKADCLCNILETGRGLCNRGVAWGVAYGALTAIDCASSLVGAPMCTIGGGAIGSAAGAVTGNPAAGGAGLIIGCFIGARKGPMIVDLMMEAFQNMMKYGGNPIPVDEIHACCRLLGIN